MGARQQTYPLRKIASAFVSSGTVRFNHSDLPHKLITGLSMTSGMSVKEFNDLQSTVYCITMVNM